MEAFDFAIGLMSIVVGLAISDLATSLHKLIRQRRRMKWDARPLLAAAFAFVLLFGMWFNLWFVRERPEILGFFFLLSLVVELVLLSLMATSALPDEPPANGSLAEFYEENATPIWSFFLLFQLSYLAHWIYFTTTSPRFSLSGLLADLPLSLLAPVAGGVLALFPRKRTLHVVMIALLLAFQLFEFSGSGIGH